MTFTRKKIEKILGEIHLARQCLESGNRFCHNEDCKNLWCPLNTAYKDTAYKE